MQDLRRFQQVDVALLASATKLCTSKQCLGQKLFEPEMSHLRLFADCLGIYDFTSQDQKLDIQAISRLF